MAARSAIDYDFDRQSWVSLFRDVPCCDYHPTPDDALRCLNRRITAAGSLKLRVHLSACFRRWEELRGYRADLEQAPIEVVSRWIDGGGQEPREDDRPIRHHPLWDVEMAQVVVAFGEQVRTGTCGSRDAEVGYALGMRKPVIWVDPPEDLFCPHRRIQRAAYWAEAQRLLYRQAAELSPFG
jgi:hypothetical protein